MRTTILLTFLAAMVTATAKDKAPVDPARTDNGQAVHTARGHIRSILKMDFDTLKTSYAKKVTLMPGHEFLKDEYGLAGPKGRAEKRDVTRADLLAAMKKDAEGQPARPDEAIDAKLKGVTTKFVDTKAGDHAENPSDPVETADGKLHFDIKSGDILVKIAPPRGDFLLVQLRNSPSGWRVVSEYID